MGRQIVHRLLISFPALLGVLFLCFCLLQVVPADPAMLDDAARHDVVLSYEDGISDGGIGALLTEAVRQRDGSRASRFVVRGVPTRFIPHAKPDVILAQLGLDAAGIEADVLSSLGR